MITSNDEYKWAKPVAMGLLVIRLSRPFAGKSAAIWVTKRGVTGGGGGLGGKLTAVKCLSLILGLISTV